MLHADLGVLQRDTAEVRLNAKALHVLLVLLDAGDKGVSRNALLDQVWGENYPSDNVISRAMADLRAAFGEKAGEQKYIRTLPKFGYQFVAEHYEIDSDKPAPQSAPSIGHARRYRNHYLVAAALALGALLLPQLQKDPAPPASLNLVLAGQKPLTSAPGLEHQPRIVPGGEWVVHAVLRRDRNDWDLFRVALSDGESQPVAVTPGVQEHGPAVSPRGDELAYVRLSDSACSVVIQSLALGVPEPVATCTRKFPTLVDWSPGGNWIAYTAAQSTEADHLRRIYQVDRVTGDARRVTDAVSSTGTDFYPRYSPTGDKLAFLRGEPQPDHRATLWVVDLESGAESRLTELPAQLGGMAWISDSLLMYSYSDAGRMRGQLRNLATGENRPIESAEFVHPEYSAVDRLLVVAELRSDRDLALLMPDGEVKTVAQSTSDDHHGQLSYDEAWIALISRRSGFDEIWITATEGGVARRLTRFDGATVRYPDWHPDGRQIIFTAQSDGGEQLFKVDVVSGSVSPVATSFTEVTTPRWMPRGDRWVFGCLDASGWGICIGDESVSSRIADGYFRPQPLDDIYVAAVDESGVLFRLSVEDGSVVEIWDGMPGRGRVGWVLDGERILFLNGGDAGDKGRILELDVVSGRLLEKYSGLLPLTDTNISIGRQSGAILFTRFQSSTDDLVYFEGFVTPP